ncbi:MAG: DUF5998 family protein, partial [Bifidobacteriaceae bacterium]|nr:DUF5998 family protein [Bifidobacteriaceae bacterium]
MIQHQDLRAQLVAVGYFPEILGDVVDASLGGEPVEAFYVHPDVAFGNGTIGRHLTVLAVTRTRLLV